MNAKAFISVLLATVLLTACGKGVSEFPQDPEDVRRAKRGKLTGEGGLTLFGGDSGESSSGGGAIGVNSYIWRATLDTLSFMPLAYADPFGGVIITDWYEDPKTPGERFKTNVVIYDKALRSDAVKVRVFKQAKDAQGQWRDVPTAEALNKELEDAILTRAREMRVQQPAKK